jgi:nucleotide-binding universal stress UspA family protein
MSAESFPVVVGIDSASDSERAVAWALDEAQSLGTELLLVHGYADEYSYGAAEIYARRPVPQLEHTAAGSNELVEAARRRAAELAPDVLVRTSVVNDRGHRALLDASKSASSVVLGSRGLKGVGSFFLGSVGAAEAARAACPVVVVREPAAALADKPVVVVGVDPGERATTVLGYAFGYADRHDLGLKAVLCWRHEGVADIGWADLVSPNEISAWLSEALAGWRVQYPKVRVDQTVVRDNAASGLVETAVGQRLLVVGSRGRHAMLGTLLGSVSQAVLHHATCPVAVVPCH